MLQKLTTWNLKYLVYVLYQNALVSELEKNNKNVVFCLFSTQGADHKEKNFLLFAKAKGCADCHFMSSSLANIFIFRPRYIDPGNEKTLKLGVKLFRWIFRIFLCIGIRASSLGKIMTHVGVIGTEKKILENRNIRKASAKLDIRPYPGNLTSSN